MRESEYFELCAYIGAIWGRELTPAQKTAGWKLLHDFKAEHVGVAVSQLADDGAERLPPWPVILKTTRAVFEHARESLPALPPGDSLSDLEHRGVLITLRAGETDEQRRRADRVSRETQQLPMIVRLKLAAELLVKPWSQVDPGAWDRVFEQRISELEQKHAVLA